MEENRTFLVITAIVNKQNIAEVPEYLVSVMQIFGQNGGKPVGKFKTVEQLSGNESPEMIAIIEFPEVDVIKNMINGDPFMALSEIRERVFSKLNMMICADL